MFWIIFGVAFVVVCIAWMVVVRGRSAGGLRGTDDNHNAVQNGAAKLTAHRYRDGGGPTPPMG